MIQYNGRDVIIPENTEYPFMLKECRTKEGKLLRKLSMQKGIDTTPRNKKK